MKGSGPLKLGGIAALYLLWLVSQCSVRYAHAIHRAKQRFVRTAHATLSMIASVAWKERSAFQERTSCNRFPGLR
jgi:hypothetical protein